MHREGEKGYSWLFFYPGRSWVGRLLVTLLILGASGAFYLWYSRSNSDASPDSLVGYGYAIAGTVFLVLALVLYTLRRRSRKQTAGKLNAALNWHVFFAIIGLVLLLMHSFGNFNPRTGTYALYGMIALTVSGFIGRFLDRLVPRLIAGEVRKALTAQGEDRIETISQNLQAIVIHNTQEIHGYSPGNRAGVPQGNNGNTHSSPSTSLVPLQGMMQQSMPFDANRSAIKTPWDLAYISLEATPQELSHENGQYRFIPDKKSSLTRPGALMPGAEEQIAALRDVQQALQREQFYRYVIRYWRLFHIALALLTVGLTIWHLVYAAQLLIPTLLHP